MKTGKLISLAAAAVLMLGSASTALAIPFFIAPSSPVDVAAGATVVSTVNYGGSGAIANITGDISVVPPVDFSLTLEHLGVVIGPDSGELEDFIGTEVGGDWTVTFTNESDIDTVIDWFLEGNTVPEPASLLLTGLGLLGLGFARRRKAA